MLCGANPKYLTTAEPSGIFFEISPFRNLDNRVKNMSDHFLSTFISFFGTYCLINNENQFFQNPDPWLQGEPI